MAPGSKTQAPLMETDSDSADGSSKKKKNFFKENIGKVTFDHNGKVLTVKEPNLNQKIIHAGFS